MMQSLFRLKPYIWPHRFMLGASLFLAIPLAAVRTSPVELVRKFIDDLAVSRDARRLFLLTLLLIAIFVLNFIIRFLHYYFLKLAVGKIGQSIRNDLYKHLVGLSADYFTKHSTGSLMSRVWNDPQYIDGAVLSIGALVREPVTFLCLFGLAFYHSWKLALITLIIIPPLAFVFSATSRNLKRYIAKISDENGRINSALQESFTGIRTIKTYRLEEYASKTFWERSEIYRKIYMKAAMLEEASHPMVELITAFVLAILVFVGGQQVIHRQMTGGELMGFLVAFALMMNPIRMFNDANIKLSQALTACDRVFEIFNWHSHIKEAENPVALGAFEKEIRLSDVHFAYPDAPQRLILKNVSFTIPKGKIIALVGASGAGKSSLVGLLPRLFDVTSGKIEIDGKDIRAASLTELRNHIAIVSQDVFLFNDTILENIRCGRLGATVDEIHKAARDAHALEFIKKLSHGFDTFIGDRGQKLSGGERQRISIARAFLRQAPILVLDEATSSLDSASERAVQEALDELMQNRTTLIIAHRLSTVRHADQILVLRDGEVVERGKHNELIEMNGEYARFHQVNRV